MYRLENPDPRPSSDFRSQQTRIPAQETDDLRSAGHCEETEDDTADQEAGMTEDCLSIPRQKLAQSQKRINQLINEKMVSKQNLYWV